MKKALHDLIFGYTDAIYVDTNAIYVEKKGKVIKIAEHDIFDDTLAFIEGHNGYYLVSLKALKKVKK